MYETMLQWLDCIWISSRCDHRIYSSVKVERSIYIVGWLSCHILAITNMLVFIFWVSEFAEATLCTSSLVYPYIVHHCAPLTCVVHHRAQGRPIYKVRITPQWDAQWNILETDSFCPWCTRARMQKIVIKWFMTYIQIKFHNVVLYQCILWWWFVLIWWCTWRFVMFVISYHPDCAQCEVVSLHVCPDWYFSVDWVYCSIQQNRGIWTNWSC